MDSDGRATERKGPKADWRVFLILLAATVVMGGLGYVWWNSLTHPFDRNIHEFRGILVYKPGQVGIPEDPPATAFLITATGTHELDVRIRTRSGISAKPHQTLTDLNGRPVIVVGKWGYRRTLAKKHRAIVVEELRLDQASTSSAPGP